MGLPKNLTVYEKCKLIRRIILNRASEVMTYHNWDTEFAAKEIRNIQPDVSTRYPELTNLQLSRLTDKQCQDLGFNKWSNKLPIRLIPLWLKGFLPKNSKTIFDINGKKVYRTKNIDNDNRFGSLAYGIIPSDKRKKNK